MTKQYLVASEIRNRFNLAHNPTIDQDIAARGAISLVCDIARRSFRPSRTADALAVVSPLAWNSLQMDNEVSV